MKMRRTVVPFCAADQPIVDELCELIIALYNTPEAYWFGGWGGVSEEQQKLLTRIVEG